MPPKPSKAKKPAPKPQVMNKSSVSLGTKAQFSNCAAEYGSSLLNPCGPAAPCLPMGFPLPSLKSKVFARGEATVGSSTSFGYVLLAPGRMAANDVDCVKFSDPAGTCTATTLAASGTGVLTASSNSAYSNAMLGNTSVQYRLVSACLRVKYRGTELNRGGRLVFLEQPDHASITGDSLTDILAYDSATSSRPPSGDGWLSVIYTGPKTPSELEYSYDTSTIDPTSGGTLANAYHMCVIFEGQAALTVEWEVWANFEFIGPNVRGRTPSHYDPIGAFTISNAIDTATSFGSTAARHVPDGPISQSTKSKNKHSNSFVSNVWSHAKHALSDGISHVVPIIKREGLKLAKDAVFPAAAGMLSFI